MDVLKRFPIKYVRDYIKKDYKRYYPEHELFGQVVGFTDTDDRGIAGLEYQYEEYLKGKSVNVPFKINGLQERI